MLQWWLRGPPQGAYLCDCSCLRGVFIRTYVAFGGIIKSLVVKIMLANSLLYVGGRIMFKSKEPMNV